MMTNIHTKRAEGKVVRLPSAELDPRALVDGLIAGDESSAELFFERFAPRINRWVWRLLGADPEHEEVVQQVFVGVLSSLKKLRDIYVLDAFVDSVTIRTVRKEIRRRGFRKRLFSKTEPCLDDVCDRSAPLREAHVRSFYSILEKLPADDRIIFVLRHLEGRSLNEIARIGGYSLSTAKRRLKKATLEFKTRALKDPVLLSMLEEYRHET
jgi:RNA polymerase sigma-70 factor (ECF subfamily)